MDWLQVVILAIVQGITEFLPVSSSAHLILVPVLTDWPDQGLAFDVALHLGSLSAVLIYFRQDIINMLQSWTRSLHTRQLDADAKLAWVLNMMSVGGFRHVPLVNTQGHPVGVVSVRDVVEFLVQSFPNEILNLPPDFGARTHLPRDGG